MNITTVTSSAEGLFSNTYLAEAPLGIIVIDPPMLLSDARAVRAELDRLDLPLAAIIYTHPHPDHVNGATEIRGESAVPVYATPDTNRVSRSIDGPKREFWTPIFPDEYPPVTTFATALIQPGSTTTIAGLSFDVVDAGPGECETASLWITGDAAFVGDLAYSNAHPWLFEARTTKWLDQLERVRPLLVNKTLYVGHGKAGDVTLIDQQASYIREYRKAVREFASADGSLSPEAVHSVKGRMTKYWPDAPLVDLIAMSAEPVAAEIAHE